MVDTRKEADGYQQSNCNGQKGYGTGLGVFLPLNSHFIRLSEIELKSSPGMEKTWLSVRRVRVDKNGVDVVEGFGKGVACTAEVLLPALGGQACAEIDLDWDLRDICSDDRVVCKAELLALLVAAEIVEHHAPVHSHQVVWSVGQVHQL